MPGNIVKVRIVQAVIFETVIIAGIYDLWRLLTKRCGRLGPRAVLALAPLEMTP